MSLLSRLVKHALKDIHRGIKGNPLPGRFHRDPFLAQQLLLSQQKTLTILDVGGNRGQSVREYRRFFPAARIYSFEPFSGVLAELRQTCAADGNAVAVHAAVSDTNGSQTLYVTTRTTMNSLKRIVGAHERVIPEEVRTITLDAFCRDERIAHVDVLKLDVQGSELAALRGAQTLLTDRTIDVIYSEALFTAQYEQQTEFFQLYGYLHGLGYRIFGFYSQRIDYRHMLQHANTIFISPGVAESLARAAA